MVVGGFPRSNLVCIPIERARRLHRRGQPAVKVGRRPPHALASQPLHHIGRVLRGGAKSSASAFSCFLQCQDESKKVRSTGFSLTKGGRQDAPCTHDGHAGSTQHPPLSGAAGAGGPLFPVTWSISRSCSADAPPSPLLPHNPTPTSVVVGVVKVVLTCQESVHA